MTPEDYVSRVGAALRPLELRLSRAIRAHLLTAFTSIRASLLRGLPDDSLSRTLQYQLLRPSLEEALVPLNDALAQLLGEELWLFQFTAQDLAAQWLGEPGPPLADTPDALMRRLRFLRQQLAAYFQRRSPSQFMREILRLVDRTVQRGILDGTPTAQIVEAILPEAVRGGRRSLVIRRGTLVNAVRSRVDAIIAASVWDTFTGAATQVWQDAITAQGQREALAWEWSAILDPRTCPVCAPLDGQRRAKPDAFGVTPPVHPFCRCALLPVSA